MGYGSAGLAPGSLRGVALDAIAMRGRWQYVRVLDDALTWSEVSALLAVPRNYWLSTTTPSGAPHAAPVWGVVIGRTLYVCSERRAVKARNLAADPRVVVHLESGDDVVIVRGTAEDLGVPAQVPSVVPAFAAKYAAPDDQQYLPGDDPGEAVYAIRAQSAMVWHLADYEASQRRWSS